MQRFEFLRQPLMGELAMSPEERKKERKKEKKMPFVVANYVYASSQGQRTHSARTKKKDGTALRKIRLKYFSLTNIYFVLRMKINFPIVLEDLSM